MQLLQSQEALFSYRTPVILVQVLCIFLPSFIHQNFIDRLLGLNKHFIFGAFTQMGTGISNITGPKPNTCPLPYLR